MARLILVLVAIGLVIFLVRALRPKPPGKGPDQKLPPPHKNDDHNSRDRREDDQVNRNDWDDREG